MATALTTDVLVDFIEKTQYLSLPASVVDKAKLLILDCLGVTVRGAAEPAARLVRSFSLDQGRPGRASLIGAPEKATAPWAALVNGTAGHALDFDDVSQPMYGHPSVAVLPAALAQAEETGASGQDLLAAYVLGVEVAVKLAYVLNPGHYEQGWHSTATLGSLGAAAAGAKLLNLSGRPLRTALALAASQAGGLQQNFGTMIKPFHAGRAAQNGLTAARLAQAGFTGDMAILEAPLGFFKVFGGPGRIAGQGEIPDLGRPWEIDSPGLILKKFPSCAFTHPAVDAALDISQAPGFQVREVIKVEARIHHLADQILIHRRPATGLEAKFSLEGCLALALQDKKLSIGSFTDESVQRPEIQALLGLVQRRVIPENEFKARDFGPASVRVFFRDGREAEVSVTKARGTPENPLSPDEAAAKFQDCGRGVLDQDQIDRALGLVASLEGLKDVRELTACLGTGPAA